MMAGSSKNRINIRWWCRSQLRLRCKPVTPRSESPSLKRPCEAISRITRAVSEHIINWIRRVIEIPASKAVAAAYVDSPMYTSWKNVHRADSYINVYIHVHACTCTCIMYPVELFCDLLRWPSPQWYTADVENRRGNAIGGTKKDTYKQCIVIFMHFLSYTLWRRWSASSWTSAARTGARRWRWRRSVRRCPPTSASRTSTSRQSSPERKSPKQPTWRWTGRLATLAGACKNTCT